MYEKLNSTGVESGYPGILGLIGNARSDSVIYGLPPEKTGKRGRPAADFLCMAGKGASEPDGERLDAVYSVIPLHISVEH